MTTDTPTFRIIENPTRIVFRVDLLDGTSPRLATTERDDIEVGELYWNSYDGELYRVTNVDNDTVDVELEFGCGEIPRDLSFNREWFTPNQHRLHHVAQQTD